MRNPTVQKVARLGMLAALAVLLAAVIRFPIFPAAPHLMFELADVPITIGAFMFGPWWGLALTAVVSVIQGVTVDAASGIAGILMHFVSTGAYVIIAGLFYQKQHTLKGAIIAMTLGSILKTVVMIPLNYIITPLFWGAPVEAVNAIIVYIILFNLIKAVGNSLVTFLVYKPISRLLRLERREKSPDGAH